MVAPYSSWDFLVRLLLNFLRRVLYIEVMLGEIYVPKWSSRLPATLF
jgi:hypothetical protein